MEMVDLFDKDRKPTGEVIVRGEPIPEGRYKQTVHMWITNSEGKVYIQKRCSDKVTFPNLWEIAGGGVVAGDNSENTLKKEFEEELGIPFEGNYELITTIHRKHDFADVYMVNQNFNVSDLRLQIEEVADAKWVGIEELESMIKAGDFCPTIGEFVDVYLNYIKQ